MSKTKSKTNTNLVSTNEVIVPEQTATVVDTTQTNVGNTVVTLQKQLGRPIVPGSARQIREAARAERKANGVFRLGRPIVPGSKKQIREAEYAAKIASGYVPKRGRPKMTKPAPENVITETVSAE